MKKSKIASYTSEELQQRESQTDWAAVDAMTDEEIEAAIASDPEEAEMHAGWMQRATVVRARPYFVMCINNKEYEHHLTIHKVYRVIPDVDAARRKMVRIIDDRGEDSMYPTRRFVLVQLPVEAEHDFDLVVA